MNGMHQNNDRLAGFKIKTKVEVVVLHNRFTIHVITKKSNFTLVYDTITSLSTNQLLYEY